MNRVRTLLTGAALTGAAAATLTAGVLAAPAQAAPQGKVDPGIGFFSIHHGTGCSYSMTMNVNASGVVSFYDAGRGHKTRLIGRDVAQGGQAAVTWTPRWQGLHRIYAVQNGEKSQVRWVRVTQGYGSGGACIAFP